MSAIADPPPKAIDWSSQDWDDLVPRLLALAAAQLARRTWRGRRAGAVPGGKMAEDIVSDAISKTIGGVRVWQPDRTSLFQHLAGVVNSDLNHLAMSLENRSSLDRPSSAGGDADIGDGWPPDQGDLRPDPERIAAWRSEQARLLRFLAEQDPMLAALAQAMLVDDIQETADLAPRLEVSSREIANLRTRLKRAIRAFVAQDTDGERGV